MLLKVPHIFGQECNSHIKAKNKKKKGQQPSLRLANIQKHVHCVKAVLSYYV